MNRCLFLFAVQLQLFEVIKVNVHHLLEHLKVPMNEERLANQSAALRLCEYLRREAPLPCFVTLGLKLSKNVNHFGQTSAEAAPSSVF